MKVIFDLDTQESIFSDSNFNTKEYNTELYNINTILKKSSEDMTPIIGTVVYHEGGNNSKLTESVVCEDDRYYNVPCTRHGIDLEIASTCDQIYFEKESANIWDVQTGQPDNLNTYLRSELVDTLYIVGVVHEENLNFTLSVLLKQHYNIVLIMDAIIFDNIDLRVGFAKEIRKFEKVTLTNTKEFLSMLPVIDDDDDDDDEWR